MFAAKLVRSNKCVILAGECVYDTPDELYDKFTRLSVSLPDDTTSWYIQLCSFLMNLCMWDNIFHDQVDTILNIQDVCRKIRTIK